MGTDKAWQFYGSSDPYFGVLTEERFTAGHLDPSTRAAFFSSGEDYVASVFDTARRHLDESFAPRRALDFGCGVGRLTLALAQRCDAVVGVDISPAMLDEARNNARCFGYTNTDFVLSDDTLSLVVGDYDLIHSFIVFQHIGPRRGRAILRKMLALLVDGGVGVLHFTYANGSATPATRRALTWTYEHAPLVYRGRNLVKREALSRPPMQMNRYEMSRVLRVLQEEGCHDLHVRFTETSHYRHAVYGVILLFVKRRLDTTAYS